MPASSKFVRMAAVGALAMAVAGGASAQSLTNEKLGFFAVPRIAAPPVIDGTIDPDEWRCSLAVSGLAQQNPGGNLLIMRPTTFFLAWDDDNVYLACRTWIMPGYKPRVGGRAHNKATAFDDGMEFNIKPLGANVSEAGSDSSYKFFITCLGTQGDMGRVSVGQIFRSWQPEFETAVRLTEPGSAPRGGSWWEAETVLPAKEFGLIGPNKAGDVWKMLLAFNHIPGWMQAAIPINSGYFDASGFPSFVLTDNTPAVHVTMDALPGIKDGVAAVRFDVHNPTAEPVDIAISARFEHWKDANTAEPMLEKSTTFTVAPGQSERFAVEEPLPVETLEKRSGGIEFRVTQRGGAGGAERELYRYYSFFKPGYPENWVTFTPPKAAFPLSAGFNPVRDNLELIGDSYYLARPADAKAMHYTVTRNGDEAPRLEGSIEGTKLYYFEKLLQLPPLPEGEYTVEGRIELADGTLVGPERATFKKLDEATVFAEWWNNGLGSTERLIPPFVALAGEGNRTFPLGRSYRLNALGLPSEILSAKAAVLAAPARITVITDGAETVVPLDDAPLFSERLDWRERFAGTARGAGLRFSVEGSIEQDGLVTLTLSFEPEGSEPVAIDALRFEFPVRDDVAENLVCIGAGGNFASHTAITLPRDKTGRLWSTLDTGIGGSMMAVGSFYPQVWLGNERRGLLWWADSDQGWSPVNETPAHEVLREGAVVTLRNNIISRRETLSAKRTLTFSYIASPFKPLPKGWRMATYSENGTFTTPEFKARKDPKTNQPINGWNWINPPSYDPAEWAALWSEFKAKADADIHAKRHFDPARARNHQGSAYVHTSIPMYGYGPQTSDKLVSGYFASEWGRGNYNPTMTDFLMWLLHRAFGEGGLRTVYWDIFYTGVFSELQAGYGYLLPDGRIQPTFHGYNLRRFMMRLYGLMNDHGLTPNANVAHSSNAFPLIAFPWIDAVMDGEFVFFRDSTVGDFYDYYSPQRMRSMAVAHNFGAGISWMLLNHITDETRAQANMRTFIDWHRMHDTWRCQDGRVAPDTILEWGLNDPELEYLPYWRESGAQALSDDLLCSVWRGRDRAIVMVFSGAARDSEPREARVRLDLGALGLVPAQAWDGAVTVKEIGAAIGGGLPSNTPRDPEVLFDPATGSVTIPGLKPRTARYIGIRVLEREDVERTRAGFKAIGQEQALSEEMLDWGVAGFDTSFLPAASVEFVKAPERIEVAMWRRADRVLLAVRNAGDARVTGVEIDMDLDALDLAPELPWQEFIRVRGFGGSAPSLDFHARKLSVGTLDAGEIRWIGVRRY